MASLGENEVEKCNRRTSRKNRICVVVRVKGRKARESVWEREEEEYVKLERKRVEGSRKGSEQRMERTNMKIKMKKGCLQY